MVLKPAAEAFLLAAPPAPAADASVESGMGAADGRAVGRVLPPLSWLEVHPSWPLLFVADRRGGADGCGSVRSAAVSPGSGAPLEELGTAQSSSGSGPCHLSVSEGFVLVANYVGGTVASLPILEDGSLGSAVCVRTHRSEGARQHARQEAAHPHMIALDPSGAFALVPDLGNNIVVVYAFDRLTGELTRGPADGLRPAPSLLAPIL
eukprot:SAG11_NODE_1333_length_5179_cov_3.502953_4_plen_207_part_00